MKHGKKKKRRIQSLLTNINSPSLFYTCTHVHTTKKQVWSKKLGPQNTYAVVTILSFIATVPMVLLADLPHLKGLWKGLEAAGKLKVRRRRRRRKKVVVAAAAEASLFLFPAFFVYTLK